MALMMQMRAGTAATAWPQQAILGVLVVKSRAAGMAAASKAAAMAVASKVAAMMVATMDTVMAVASSILVTMAAVKLSSAGEVAPHLMKVIGSLA